MEAILRLRPDYADALLNLGVAHSELGQRTEEIKAYEEALRSSPTDQQVLGNLALAHSEARNYEAVMSVSRQLIHLAPENPRYHFLLAWSLSSVNRSAEAIEEYQSAVQLRPDFFEAEENLAALYSALRQDELRLLWLIRGP